MVAPTCKSERFVARYSLTARSVPEEERSPPHAEPRWNVVFEAPLLLRTLLRLVFYCSHRHKSPPITLRVTVSSSVFGCGSVFGRETYITCLDCGQKFAYNHKTGQFVDFWGIHDAEALAEVRRRVDGFFSPLRGRAARIDKLNMKVSISALFSSVLRVATGTMDGWIESFKIDFARMWRGRRDPNPRSSASKADALSN